MFLKEFREKTAHLPDNTRIVFPNSIGMNEYQTVYGIVICDTLMCVDCFDERHWSDIGVCMPEDEKFGTIIIDTIH